MPRKKKKKAGQRRERPSFPARFGVGTHVRVKPGTTVPDFENPPFNIGNDGGPAPGYTRGPGQDRRSRPRVPSDGEGTQRAPYVSISARR